MIFSDCFAQRIRKCRSREAFDAQITVSLVILVALRFRVFGSGKGESNLYYHTQRLLAHSSY